MLAEPKRKIRWSLNPRGNLWSKDENKFGQRLMQKMGWEKGKGLGKFEDGQVDHIAVSYKCDNNGIGYDGKDVGWAAHQEEFDSLLANLNQCYSTGKTGSAVADDQESEKSVGLMQRAKYFKSRLHYRKFLRGKDVSQYSQKDFDSIIGKKMVSPEEASALS